MPENVTIRKPIQIAMAQGSFYNLYTVLCDDGTIWCKINEGDNAWRMLPPIPQDQYITIMKKKQKGE